MWSADAILAGLSIAAYVAVGMTAALAAGRREMDWFGVAVLGSITALGGGSTRDMLLGHYPLAWVKEPWLLALTAGAALATIPLGRIVHHFRLLFLVLDAIGLVVFTILGCDVALDSGQGMVIAVVAGMITGCVGGVLRNDVPLLFRGELYASVSLVTGAIYVGAAHFGVNHGLSTVIVFVIGLTFRLLAIMLHWEMPKFIYDRDP